MTSLAPSSSRRHFLRGVGVALALPWMESLPVFGQTAPPRRRPQPPPLRLGIVFFSNGVEPAHWWAKGSGAAMELGPGLLPMLPHREDMVFISGLFNQSALVSTSPHLGPHEPAVGRAGQPRSQRDSRRHVDGSGDRRGHRRSDRDPEPRARHRAQRAAARGRALDDLRVEPVVGVADQAGDQGDLSRRGPSIASSATARAARWTAASSTPCGRSRRASGRASAGRQPQAERVSSRGFATSRSGSSGPRRRSVSKAGGRRSRSPTCRARSTSCRRTCRIT